MAKPTKDLGRPSAATVSKHVPILFIPPGFAPERLLKRAGVRHADKARLFVHMLYERMLFDHRDYKRPDGVPEHAVTLKASILQRILGKRYRLILLDLEAAGVIHIYRTATTGRSYHYWFDDRYLNTVFKAYIPTSGQVCARLEVAASKKQQVLECPVAQYVCDQLGRIQIDQGSMLAALDSMVGWSPFYARNRLERLLSGHIHCKRDDFGRIHHNITSLNKSLRASIRVEGEPLTELDITNSQPLFLGLACLAWLRCGKSRSFLMDEGEKSILNTLREIQAVENAKQARLNTQHQPLSSLPLWYDVKGELPTDVRHYLEVCELGRLYETLGEAVGKELATSNQRDRFKRQVFCLLFARQPRKFKRVYQAFQKRFPTILALVNQASSCSKSRSAGVLQRVESTFMLDIVAARIIRERPGIFLSTIHDCVVVKRGDAEYVRQVFAEEFQRLGIKATLNLTEHGT